MTPPVLTLARGRSTDQGTLGVLLRPDGSRLCYTMELPWKGNRPRVSSIPPGALPEGRYLCRVRFSPHFGRVYEITGVPGRSNVLMHTGNWGGDVSKGYRSHVLGCVVLGLYHGRREGQMAVMVSRPAVTKLMQEMQEQPFTLEVIPWAFSTSSPAGSEASSEPPEPSPARSST